MKKNIRVLIAVVIGICLVLGYYYYLNHRNVGDAQSKPDEITEVEDIIETDLDAKYPKTPREVVKFYNRIVSCYYNESHKEGQLEKLADQQLKLLDKELIANNPKETFMDDLKSDIEAYKAAEKTISDVTVSGTGDVVYKKVDGRECAYVTASYFIKEKSSYDRTYQRYVLRKDDSGHWKILVFYIIEGETNGN